MAFLSGMAEAMKSAGMLSILAKALAAVVGGGYPAALNSSGGALGNMICPNNVIAVCATVNFQNQEGIVMRKVIPALAVLMIGEMIAALLYVHVIFPGYYM